MSDPDFENARTEATSASSLDASLWTVVGSAIGIYLLYALARIVLPGLSDLWGVALIFGFYWLPVRVMRNDPDFLAGELALRDDGRLIPRWDNRGWIVALIAALIIFPLFTLGFFAFYDRICAGDLRSLGAVLWLEEHTPLAGRLESFLGRLCQHYPGSFWPEALRLPSAWTKWYGGGFVLELLIGLFAIALPEEIFHRGYLQGALERRFSPRVRVLGVPMGFAALLASALFALGHLIAMQETSRLATFFPSLVFAWLWRRSGSLWAPAIFHAASNLLMDLLLATTFPRT